MGRWRRGKKRKKEKRRRGESFSPVSSKFRYNDFFAHLRGGGNMATIERE